MEGDDGDEDEEDSDTLDTINNRINGLMCNEYYNQLLYNFDLFYFQGRRRERQ